MAPLCPLLFPPPSYQIWYTIKIINFSFVTRLLRKKTAYLHVEGTTLFYAFLECLQDSCSWKLSKKKQESSLLKLRISMSIERRWEPENGENAGGRRWQSENEGGQVSPALLKTRTICRPVVQSITKYLWVSILHKSNRKWFSEIYDGRHCGL